MKEQVKIKLLKIIEGNTDDWGNPVNETKYSTVYALKKSASQNEFYHANSNGMKPQYVFEIYKNEYDEQEILFYKDVEYSIIRLYESTLDKIELVCEKKLSNA